MNRITISCDPYVASYFRNNYGQVVNISKLPMILLPLKNMVESKYRENEYRQPAVKADTVVFLVNKHFCKNAGKVMPQCKEMQFSLFLKNFVQRLILAKFEVYEKMKKVVKMTNEGIFEEVLSDLRIDAETIKFEMVIKKIQRIKKNVPHKCP